MLCKRHFQEFKKEGIPYIKMGPKCVICMSTNNGKRKKVDYSIQPESLYIGDKEKKA